MSVGSVRNIPHFIVAASPRGLQRLMLLNNTRHGMQFNYFQIQWDGKQWVAWYLRSAEIPTVPLATAVNDVDTAE